LPILWFTSKTYYEERGSKVNEWNWCDPFIDELSTDALLEYCEKHPPNIFGFSVFLWSYLEIDVIAKTIKELYPDCLIVYGGPQNNNKYSFDFFQKKPWVDVVVPGDVYGEPILCQILDQFDNLNIADIPEVFYHRKGFQFKSKVQFAKRDFTWPKNIFKSQEKYFNFDTNNSMVVYETSRGCPYKCIYCDWGGGVYTKVVKKPIETVFAELEFLCSHNIETFYISDANFGIFKEDIDIIKHVATLKKKYGYPKSVMVENAKNNLDRVMEIQEVLISNKLSFYYKLSVQNPHDDIKKNIERVDIPFEDHLAAIRKLREKYNAPILIETILGLPGDSYQRTLESIDLFQSHDIEGFRPSIWQLLPETPAFGPEMREKFQIKTKWFEIYTVPFRYKNNAIVDQGVSGIANKNPMFSENVISTYSYSEQEWCDMLVLTMLSGVGKTVGMDFLIKYINDVHDRSPSFYYDHLYREIVVNKKFNDPILNDKLGDIPTKLYNLLEDPSATTIEFDIGKDFPLLLAPYVYVVFTIMLYPKEFFTSVTNYFANLLDDDKILDLGIFLTQIMIDIDYDPNIGRKFITEYNWYSYYNNERALVKSKYEYTLLDSQLKFVSNDDNEYSDYPSHSDPIQKMKQFFYHRASNPSRKKYAQKIVEQEII